MSLTSIFHISDAATVAVGIPKYTVAVRTRFGKLLGHFHLSGPSARHTPEHIRICPASSTLPPLW